ncbi:MAG: 2,3-bisphosphoglycerate-dependent phosphoglycerate mutase [Planctomycetota bacterium]
MHAHLVLVRHGESEGNAQAAFSGWRDVALTELGGAQAFASGSKLRELGCVVDYVCTSQLQRARETATHLLRGSGQADLLVASNWRLNERHCGAFQGMGKEAVKRQFGEDALRSFRGCWSSAPPLAGVGTVDDPRSSSVYEGVEGALPLGESMRDLVDRVSLAWREDLLPRLRAGQRLMVVAHAVSLRALAYLIEGQSTEQLPDMLWRNAQARWYGVNANLSLTGLHDVLPD